MLRFLPLPPTSGAAVVRSTLLAAVLWAGAQGAWATMPVVRTVPWVPANPLIPHDTWATPSARTISLKGVCTIPTPYSNFEFWWDYGDGGSSAITTVGNPNNLEWTHAYTGGSGTIYTARLYVRDKTTGETANGTYFVAVRDKTLDVEVNVAIDEGLWWIFKSAERLGGGQFRWNNYRYGTHYANTTASSVQAFEVNGHLDGQPDNPYADAVHGGLDYLFTTLYAQSMSLQDGENPDANSNGLGLSVNSDHPIYETGAVMDALVASGMPDARSRTGVANVYDRRFQDLVQDMADMYSWGQSDPSYSSHYAGGWRYSWNGDSDNSAAQWGAIGMIAAERHFGCTIPSWVKTRNLNWLENSYNGGGWFGYANSVANVTFSTGPCGMVQLSFDGEATSNAKWIACENFLDANWAAFISPWRDTRYYSYYAFAKAMRVALPSPLTTIRPSGRNWYHDPTDGLARILVDRQRSDGYWDYDGWPYVGESTSAAWSVLILSRTLFDPGSPVAVAKATPNPVVAGQWIQLDGSDSFHQDGSKIIDSWEWDLDNNGSYETSGVFATVQFPAVGDYPVKLRVTDNSSPEKSAETTIVLRVNTPPIAPTASTGGPYVFCTGITPWLLDGSGSVNPDEGQHEPGQPGDTIMTYVWELDGDNDFNDATGSVADVTAYFEGVGPGSYLVQLKVTDRTATSFPSSGQGNLSDTDSTTVVVRSAADPECACISVVARAKSHKVQLVWTHSGAHHYNVYRSTASAGPYEKIGTTTSTYSTYLDYSVVNGTTYHYVVREANVLDRESCQSQPVSTTPRGR